MLRVAYVAVWRHGASSGPFRKMAEQAARWSAEGLETGMFVLTEPRSVADWQALPTAVRVLPGSERPLERQRQKLSLVRAAVGWGADLAYHRYAMPSPAMVALGRAMPMVLEVNTRDRTEFALGSRLHGLANQLLRGPAFRAAAGLSFVSHELAGHPEFTRFHRPGVVVGNGIDLSAVPTAPAPGNDAPRLVFLAEPGNPWHGLDKIVWLAGQRPSWRIDVIGPSPADTGVAPSNLLAHGVLPAAGYRPLLAAADVAISTLALHRNGMQEASPLKTREYLATGLPVICGYRDTDIPPDAAYALQLPNREDNVRTHLAELDGFVATWRGRRVPRAAVAHLDVGVKERGRVDFLRSLAKGRERALG